MIIISVIVFKQPLSIRSVIGCILTIAGSFWYSVERYNFDNRDKKLDKSTVESDEEEEKSPLITKNSSPIRKM